MKKMPFPWMLLIIGVILVSGNVIGWVLYAKAREGMDNANFYALFLEKLSGIGRLETEHLHADFIVYINGQEIELHHEDLEAPEYGSKEFWTQMKVSRFVHIHEGTDNVNLIHVHASGITLGMFFNSIDGIINTECVSLPSSLNLENTEYCSNEGISLKVYVNSERIFDLNSYLLQDLDKILITYGSESIQEIDDQFELIGSRACVQSNRC